MKKIALLSLISFSILATQACVPQLRPADSTAQRIFTYDYVVKDKSKDQIWISARNYLSGAYGDSRSVFRVMDKKEGDIIGKALARWSLMSNQCSTAYNIQFAAKDGKARLRFELLHGVPPLSSCVGWPWPTESGYAQVVSTFKSLANSLGTNLRGEGKSNDFKNF